MTSGGSPSGVVCDDRPEVRRSLTGLLAGSGFTVAGEAHTFPALRRLVLAEQPAVAVISLHLVGIRGLAAVASLRAEVETCLVVLLSGFEELEPAALEAGASALVAEDDPQALQAVLRRISSAAGPPQVVVLPDHSDQAETLPRPRNGSGEPVVS